MTQQNAPKQNMLNKRKRHKRQSHGTCWTKKTNTTKSTHTAHVERKTQHKAFIQNVLSNGAKIKKDKMTQQWRTNNTTNHKWQQNTRKRTTITIDGRRSTVNGFSYDRLVRPKSNVESPWFISLVIDHEWNKPRRFDLARVRSQAKLVGFDGDIALTDWCVRKATTKGARGLFHSRSITSVIRPGVSILRPGFISRVK